MEETYYNEHWMYMYNALHAGQTTYTCIYAYILVEMQ